MLLGHRPIAAVEIDKYCRRILNRRQRDGVLPRFPIFPDVRAFDGKPWRGLVDILGGGFPCQGISSSGKGLGIRADPRSGLWSEFARIIGEIEPPFVFIENSPLLLDRGMDIVLRDLASLGYDARWGVLGAWHLGAAHKRDRIWILAHSMQDGCKDGGINVMSRASEKTIGKKNSGKSSNTKTPIQLANCRSNPWGKTQSIESRLGRVADGIPHQMDRVGCLGNAQVPQVAATAFLILSQGLI